MAPTSGSYTLLRAIPRRLLRVTISLPSPGEMRGASATVVVPGGIEDRHRITTQARLSVRRRYLTTPVRCRHLMRPNGPFRRVRPDCRPRSPGTGNSIWRRSQNHVPDFRRSSPVCVTATRSPTCFEQPAQARTTVLLELCRQRCLRTAPKTPTRMSNRSS